MGRNSFLWHSICHAERSQCNYLEDDSTFFGMKRLYTWTRMPLEFFTISEDPQIENFRKHSST